MRLFTGISLPDNITAHINTFRGTLPNIHWNHPDNYYIELCSIDEITNYALLDDIDLAFEKIQTSQIELMIQGVSHSTTSMHEHHIYANVTQSPSLLRLKKKIEFILHQYNMPAKKRRYSPRVALAKGIGLNEDQISNWLYKYNLFKTETFQVNQFSLFSTYPNSDEPYYKTEANYSLI